jgi:Na+-translocating ferredoxin:NAD+ oxidoreductase subunit B
MKTMFIQLSKAYKFSDSKYFPKILEMILSEKEASVLLSLPGTVGEVAEKNGMEESAVQSILENQSKRGLIICEIQDGEKVYDLDTSDRFQSSAIVMGGRSFGNDALDLWAKMSDEESSAGFDEEGHSVRIIPVERTLENGKTILPYEKVSQILRDSETISVGPCACRTMKRKCDNPIDVCMTKDELAEKLLSRGIGRQIDIEEAESILKECEEFGLVHAVSDSSKGFSWLCNCCNCCCGFLKAQQKLGKKYAVTKSRYLSVIDSENCDGCEICIDRCQFDAIQMSATHAVIDKEKCFGCGLCASTCPVDAIKMILVRTPDHIPEREFQPDNFYL